MTIAAIWTIIY